MPQLLIFVLYDESAQATIAALREKDEEDHGEESATIIVARCLKNSEKIKKIVKNEGSEKEARWPHSLGKEQTAGRPVKFLTFEGGPPHKMPQRLEEVWRSSAPSDGVQIHTQTKHVDENVL